MIRIPEECLKFRWLPFPPWCLNPTIAAFGACSEPVEGMPDSKPHPIPTVHCNKCLAPVSTAARFYHSPTGRAKGGI